MRNNTPFYIFIGFMALVVVVFTLVCTAFYAGQTKAPEGLKPGDSVAVLLNKTVLEENKPCQQYYQGFISPTGPEGQNYWVTPERFLFPFQKLLSVISSTGKVAWEYSYDVVKLPADPNLLLCSSPINSK